MHGSLRNDGTRSRPPTTAARRQTRRGGGTSGASERAQPEACSGRGKSFHSPALVIRGGDSSNAVSLGAGSIAGASAGARSTPWSICRPVATARQSSQG